MKEIIKGFVGLVFLLCIMKGIPMPMDGGVQAAEEEERLNVDSAISWSVSGETMVITGEGILYEK